MSNRIIQTSRANVLWLVDNRSSVTAEAEHCVTVAKFLDHNHEITSSLGGFNFAQQSA